MTDERPLDHGRTLYTVTLQFSDDYPDAESVGSPLHWDWAGLLDQPDARCVALVEAENPDYGLHPLEILHRRLADWEHNECTDADQTIRAWTYMGILTAALALAEQGVHLPQRWMDDQIEAVNDLMGVEEVPA